MSKPLSHHELALEEIRLLSYHTHVPQLLKEVMQTTAFSWVPATGLGALRELTQLSLPLALSESCSLPLQKYKLPPPATVREALIFIPQPQCVLSLLLRLKLCSELIDLALAVWTEVHLGNLRNSPSSPQCPIWGITASLQASSSFWSQSSSLQCSCKEKGSSPLSKVTSESWEEAQSGKCLPCKSGDLSSIPQNSWKNRCLLCQYWGV